MKLSNILIGLLVFSLIIVGFVSVYEDLITTYGVEDELNISNYRANYDSVNETSAIASESSDLLTNKSITEGTASESTTANMWGAVKLIYRSPGIINKLLNQVMIDLHIPVWMRMYWWAIVLITITFTLIAVFWKSKNV